MAESSESLKEKGNACFRQQQYFEAEKYYLSAIQVANQNDKETLSILYTNLSNAQCQIEKIPEAIDNATKAIEFNNKNPKAYLRRGDAKVKGLNLTEAYNDYVAGYKVIPANDTKFQKYFHDRCNELKKQIEVDVYRRGLSQDADSPRAPPPRPKTPANESQENPTFNSEYAIKLMNDMANFKRPLTHVVNLMLSQMKEINKQLPNIVNINIQKQIRIVGDVHGQYQDFMQIFEKFGYPSPDNKYLFNGDYVDRGSMGVEILLALFAWKLAYPDSIFMNRGNQYVFYSQQNLIKIFFFKNSIK